MISWVISKLLKIYSTIAGGTETENWAMYGLRSPNPMIVFLINVLITTILIKNWVVENKKYSYLETANNITILYNI